MSFRNESVAADPPTLVHVLGNLSDYPELAGRLVGQLGGLSNNDVTLILMSAFPEHQKDHRQLSRPLKTEIAK